MAQNFLLIWLATNIDQSITSCYGIRTQLRAVGIDFNIFNQPDECVDFLTEVGDRKVFWIVEGIIGQQIVPLIHDIPQLNAIYILCDNKPQHDGWASKFLKLKGVYMEITTICEAIQMEVKQYNQNAIPMSFITVGEANSIENLDQLEPSFMYTQIFKEILLEMEYNRQSLKDFTTYCRKGNYGSSHNIDRFENEYQSQLAVWWYTFPSFIFSLLNWALRTMEAETIIKMGFFIFDLHHQIEALHRQQIGSYNKKAFTVYRGQGLSKPDFEKLLKTKSGLLSFNNFLSTTKNRGISLEYAESVLGNVDMVGVLFQMSIDPSVSSTPFASIQSISYFKTEEEILFSMHTVFRMGEIKQMDYNSSLYQVELKLTSDNDQQLCALTSRIRQEAVGPTQWAQLGSLLLKIGQFDKADDLYRLLLEQAAYNSEKAHYFHQLGYIKSHQGNYAKAISYYEKSLEIKQKDLHPSHPVLSTSYYNLASVYDNMGEYSRALSLYEKALKIQQISLPPNHLYLAQSYNIGLVYSNLGKYSNSISFFEKSLDIFEKSLPPNHPLLTTSYSGIGGIYQTMKEYSKALPFYEKALEILKKTLPPDHPSLAVSYNNIGGLYNNMKEYSKALSFHETALEIQRTALRSNHPDLAISHNNIGLVYLNMREYFTSLSFFEISLEIFEKNLPPNHPNLVTSWNNIASVYKHMGEYSKALTFYERGLAIAQLSVPLNHPRLQNLRESIKLVKMKL
jgi:tetratricopeptide (TPR) repeat protein